MVILLFLSVFGSGSAFVYGSVNLLTGPDRVFWSRKKRLNPVFFKAWERSGSINSGNQQIRTKEI